jgi:hypothetical protein
MTATMADTAPGFGPPIIRTHTAVGNYCPISVLLSRLCAAKFACRCLYLVSNARCDDRELAKIGPAKFLGSISRGRVA